MMAGANDEPSTPISATSPATPSTSERADAPAGDVRLLRDDELLPLATTAGSNRSPLRSHRGHVATGELLAGSYVEYTDFVGTVGQERASGTQYPQMGSTGSAPALRRGTAPSLRKVATWEC